MKDKALKYYEYFLLATEQNHSLFTEILDRIWIDFVLTDRSGNFRSGPIGESMTLGSLIRIGHQHLPSLHFKKAIILWKCGALHETITMTSAALDFYLSATESFEKLIYNQNDTRTKQALNYLLSRKYAFADTYGSYLWLKSSELSHLAMFSAVSEHDKWKCILQRLKMLKMNHINNQWEFHLTIEYALLDSELCAILLDKMLEVCNDQTYSDECNTSLDIHSVICCFEFISHWYFAKDRCLQSLLFRQCQFELESKIFNDHPHVAWSLRFIGLIFQKTEEYDLSLGYLNRALTIFERLHSEEHTDIENLEECISQVKEMMCTAHSPQISKSLMKMTSEQQVKCMPQMLQMSFHID
jgi:tetratricopeptide (TPR) repeat protein